MDYFKDDLLRIERKTRSKMSFENEEKLKILIERSRLQRDEYYRKNLEQQISGANVTEKE